MRRYAIGEYVLAKTEDSIPYKIIGEERHADGTVVYRLLADGLPYDQAFNVHEADILCATVTRACRKCYTGAADGNDMLCSECRKIEAYYNHL